MISAVAAAILEEADEECAGPAPPIKAAGPISSLGEKEPPPIDKLGFPLRPVKENGI